jgi:hypothetical protein
MRTLLPLSVVALSVVGCATQSEPTETANAEAARERCDTILTVAASRSAIAAT